MRSRVAWLVVVVLCLPASAGAHGHTWDFFGGPTFAGGSLLWGWHQTVAITSPKPIGHDLSVLFDLTNLKGTHDGEDVTQLIYQVGARFAFNGEAIHNLFSGHALLGAVHRQQGDQDGTDLAFTYGVSYDGLFGKRRESGWAFRAQVDHTLKNDKNFVRVSLGVVRRF